MTDKQYEMLFNCLEEIIQVLCYQPDIPQAHKVDLFNKLGEFAKAFYDIKKDKHE